MDKKIKTLNYPNNHVDQNPKVLRWPNKVEVADSFTNWEKSALLQSRQSLCVDMVADDGKWGISDKCLNQQNFICQISDRKVVNPPTVLPANGSCDPAWEAYSFSCYFFSQDDSKSWLEAQRACEDERAYLVKVDDVREMSFISGKLVSSSWIGINDRETEGQWVWHDNTVATYNNWAPDKPDNVDSGSEAHCGTVLFGNAKGLWDDVRCNEHRAYICEKTIASFTAKCGMFWEDDSFSEYCYQVNVGTLSWDEARLQCQHNGGDLASVTSLREQQYIAGKIGAISDMRYYWLGGNDLRYQNVWTWNDGAAFAYLNWAKGHPNSEQRKDCMEIDASKTEWKSEDCRQRRGYICKKKGHVTVTTSTVTTVDIGYPYCTDGWKHNDQSCYKVVKDKKQWSLAINACRREGGDLVSILSANENNFVSSLTGEMGYDPKEIWLGLNSKRMFNQYEWTDDSVVTFTSWKEREPSGHHGNGQCVSLLTTAEDIGKWKNNDCDQWLPFICKKIATHMVSPPTVMYDGCNKTAVGYRGSCYTVSNTIATWTEAGRLCNGSGGYLLALNNHLEQAYISGLIGNKATDTEYWIGLSKGSVESSYKWLTKNSQSTFTNWNKFHTGNEEYVCVAVSKTPDITGEWVDRKCSQRKLFICEYPRAGYVGDTPTTPSVSYECPEGWGWREFGDFCYKRYHHRGGYSWYEGRDHCRTIGGDLASFHSEIHLWNASDVSKYALRSPDIFWIGLSKPDKKTSHIWSDGSALDFTYWKDGEPNDHNGQEDCVEMNRHLGRWSDVNCYASRGVLCQLRKGDPLLTTVTATSPTPASQCGSDSKWFAYKDYCYTVSQSYGTNEVVSWQDARGQCLQSGGDLASIHDSDENDFVLYIASHKSFASKYWIGLNELDLENYKWSDGTATDYTSWSLNEPNDLHGGQKCVIFITETGHWSDENCGEALSYICKKHKDSSTTATPTPTPVIHGQCPVGFHGIGNKCYLIQGDGTDVSTLKNWTEAIDACAALNSKYTLASITNPLEEALVTTLLKGKTVDFWLGISMFWVGTRHRMRKFQWTDNTKVDFLYWDHGEPNGQSYGADMENCVSISTKTLSVGHWQDRKCAIRMGYVCQAWKDPTLTTQAPTQATTSCPLGYLSFGDACYQMTSPMTWEVAKVTCERQQDTLVSIMDGYEQAFLMLVTQQPPQPIWLGIYRNGSTYQWVDGWPVDYLNWASIAPIGIDPSKCIALMPGGRWNDMPCTANLPSPHLPLLFLNLKTQGSVRVATHGVHTATTAINLTNNSRGGAKRTFIVINKAGR
ncbi:macrophage mannose receptor 1-like [Lingula anatina]|uniref:Macrophage mannose receptor 1-like n=1 Tax=Lingula anatina TaxID=7574 RepID=A0A1S3H0F7_LINAN|nr:macrophage mannose receptor 1-like [Lingula anatina]|eukprot:XP_013379605.1 macrophage mannose receptor 1-like [Lingula anatina]